MSFGISQNMPRTAYPTTNGPAVDTPAPATTPFENPAELPTPPKSADPARQHDSYESAKSPSENPFAVSVSRAWGNLKRLVESPF